MESSVAPLRSLRPRKEGKRREQDKGPGFRDLGTAWLCRDLRVELSTGEKRAAGLPSSVAKGENLVQPTPP